MPSSCPLAAEVHPPCSTALPVLPLCTHLPLHLVRYTRLCGAAVDESHAHEETGMQACRPVALGVQAWRPELRRW